MPFGVTGGPGTFQFAMNATLSPLLRKCALVFLDDILIYSSTWEDHLARIEAVLQLLHQDGCLVSALLLREPLLTWATLFLLRGLLLTLPRYRLFKLGQHPLLSKNLGAFWALLGIIESLSDIMASLASLLPIS